MGPVERVVAEAVASAVGVDPEKVVPYVATTRARLGDVVIDLAGLIPFADAAGWEVVVEPLRGLPSVTNVLHVPPRLYVSLSDEAVVAAVSGAVAAAGHRYGDSAAWAGRAVAVASADPNLNKALHVGHLRNAALGMAIGNLFQTAGAHVRRTCMESDWGPHIAEAVVGYVRWGAGTTPESAGMRPAEFVGHFYARYHEALREAPEDLRREHAAFVERMVRDDEEARALVDRVTGWAATGIHALYARAGIGFDEVRRERAMLSRSREVVEAAVRDGTFHRRDDGSVAVDLSDAGLPQVTLVRGNGLPVSYTQWLGVDFLRYGDGGLDRIVQLDGAEWQAGNLPYEAILTRLGAPWIGYRDVAYYGMVNGAKGRKLGSRSGEAVTADALFDAVRDRLPELLADPKGSRLPAPLAEDGAVALVTYALLRKRRIDPLVFDDCALYSAALPDLVALYRLCAPEAQSAPLPAASARALALELNETSRVLSRALAELDAVSVLRHLGYVAKHAAAGVPAELRDATATVVRKCLAVVNVRVPLDLATWRLPSAPLLRRRTRL